MKDVREREIKDIMTESIEVLRKQGVTSIYISLDMDVLGSTHLRQVVQRLVLGEWIARLYWMRLNFLAKNLSFKGMDIVEIDPTLDFRDMTSRVAAQVIVSFLLARETIREEIRI